MSYTLVEAESFWDCVDSLRRDDRYKAHIVDTLSELRRQPFHNPRLSTHDIGVASNGAKLFCSDVGGRNSDRRIVWQVLNRTIVVLLYGSHKVQDRAKRMRLAYDESSRIVQVYEQAPDTAVETPYREQRSRVGKLLMAWTDAELAERGLPEPAVAHLRRLDNVDELFELQPHLGERLVELAFDLVAGPPPDDGRPPQGADKAPSAPEPTGPPTPPAPGAAAADGPAKADAAERDGDEPRREPEAVAPAATPEDRMLEHLLGDEVAGALFTRTEPEYMAEVVGKPIEDWMVFLHPDQRSAATRRYQGPARVRGAAGTGKTVVGLHRAAHLAGIRRRALADRAGQLVADDTPMPPVLFTTYISSLPPVLERLYERIPGTRGGEVEFINVDKLARRVCNEAGDRAFVNANKADTAFKEALGEVVTAGTPLDGRCTGRYLRDEVARVIKGRGVATLDEYLELARTGRRTALGRLQRTQVWHLKEAWDAHMARHGTIDFADVVLRALGHARRRSTPAYSAVIVDEAQDLTLAGLQLLRALLNAPDHDTDRADGLFILGDGAQRIYPGGFTLRQAGVEVRGRTTVLSENYRNTAEILAAAMAVAGGWRIEDLAEEFERGAESPNAARSGPPPEFVEIDGIDARIADIARRVESLRGAGRGLGAGDVAVLAPDNRMVNRYRSGLADRGIQTQPLDGYDGQPNDLVKVGTFHRGKGLEFKVVFLPELHRFPPEAPKGAGDEEAAEARDLAISSLFVAMTRARDHLVVVHGPGLAPEIASAAAHFERGAPGQERPLTTL